MGLLLEVPTLRGFITQVQLSQGASELNIGLGVSLNKPKEQAEQAESK